MITGRDKVYIGIIIALLLIIGVLYFEYRGESEEKTTLSEQILQYAGTRIFFAQTYIDTLFEILSKTPTDLQSIANNMSYAQSQYYQLSVYSSKINDHLLDARSLVSLVLEYGGISREGLNMVNQILDDASAIIHGIGDTSSSILLLLDRVYVENNTIMEGPVDDLVRNLKILEVYKNMSSEIKSVFDNLRILKNYLYRGGDTYPIIQLMNRFRELKKNIDDIIAWKVYGVTTTVTPTIIRFLG